MPYSETNWLSAGAVYSLRTRSRGVDGVVLCPKYDHNEAGMVGLIHMGGRLYDAKLGRMLNADPFVQAPSNSQSFNLYSYVMNNPISMVDPSGYLWNPIKKLTKAVSRLGNYVGGRYAQLDDWQRQYTDQFGQWFREKVAENPQTFAVLQAAACIAATSVAGPAGCAVVQGVTTGVLTKDFKAGVRAYAIATLTPDAGGSGWVKVAQGAAIAGVSAKLSGADKPWRAAVAGGASTAFAEFAPTSWKATNADGYTVHAIQGAMLGGTTSVVMGGGSEGFVNGAGSGAFSALFSCNDDPSSCGKSVLNGGDNPNVAFVGGAGDTGMGRIVANQYNEYVSQGGEAVYFSWDQKEELAAWIDANAGKELTVIAHSYGADTAASVIASGRSVHTLVTVDPVSWNRPNFSDVANNVTRWHYVYASGGSGWNTNNLIARIGGAWGAEALPYVTSFFNDLERDHASVCVEHCKK